jgi:transposase
MSQCITSTCLATMAPNTTPEMRENMVVWHYEQCKTVLQISKLAHCSKRTVYDVLRLHRAFGQVINPFVRERGRPCTFRNGDLEYLRSLLQVNPALYLDELQENLLSVRDVDISIATISRALRGMALTHKEQAKKVAERNEMLRAVWQAEYFVWLDELSVDDKTNQCTEGWAPLGCACVCRATFI